MRAAGWLIPVGLAACSGPARRPGSEPERPEIGGFHTSGIGAQRALEARFAALPDPGSCERLLRRLTAEPHVAGTPANDRVASAIAEEFRAAGLEPRFADYEVLLSYPGRIEVELLDPERVPLARSEEGYPHLPPWHAYSPSCDLEGEVVFANYARPEDFDRLAALGIETRGRIVLARHFRGYRGGKVLEAQRRGAAALLTYSDPADDGFGKGDPYPRGPWGPDDKVQRGATAFDFLVPGDPLTPGWPSTPGAPRIAIEEAASLPDLPSCPLAPRDAAEILSRLSGADAPEGWRGALPFPYHLGPGPARVRMRLEVSREVRRIRNVIARIEGRERPDEIVLLTNHHDAWVFGAVDPGSGTVAMLEVARGFGALLRGGWRPRRTILLASFDAEEFTLTGSTEWGEEHAEELRRGAIACLNVDSAVCGSAFGATATPSLWGFLREVAGALEDPATGRTVLEAWRERSGAAPGGGVRYVEGGRAPDGGPTVNVPGSGSDYTVFLNHLGIPIADLAFEGPYGVYHSVHDNADWMARFGDPGFRYHALAARLWGIAALRLAECDVPPLDYAPYARVIEAALPEEDARLDGARRAARALGEQAERTNRAVEEVLLHPGGPEGRSASLARALLRAERAFCREEGLPDRPWFRHQIFAPLPSYLAETLPRLRRALREDAAVEREAARLVETLEAVRAALVPEDAP
ncbi:MAG: M28 family metallopeptidase [Planctomycetota bacterium]